MHVSDGERSIVRERDSERGRKRGREEERKRGKEEDRKRGRQEERKRGKEERQSAAEHTHEHARSTLRAQKVLTALASAARLTPIRFVTVA